MAADRRPASRIWRGVLWASVVVVGVALAGAAGFGLGKRTLDSAPAVPVAAAPATVVATDGTLVDERAMSAQAEWERTGAILNRLSGTVTLGSVGTPNAVLEIAAGDVLYAVDGLVVMALPGETPAYRAMGVGSSGADVRQLQEFLSSGGYLSGDVDGKWGSLTSAAYKQWRADRFLPERKEVALGEIVFIPSLPLSVTPTDAIAAGGLIADGDVTFDVLAAAPTLRLSFGVDGSVQVPAGTPVDVDIDQEPVAMVATDRQSVADTGARLVELESTGSAGCESWCGSIPTSGVSLWPATVRFGGPATGVVVPVGAIAGGAGSTASVTLQDGSTVPVVVVLQVGGDAVVTGVDVGDVIVLPGTGSP